MLIAQPSVLLCRILKHVQNSWRTTHDLEITFSFNKDL